MCVCRGRMGGRERERKRVGGGEPAPFGSNPNITVKNSTALGDKQHPRMLWEWQRREGRKEGRKKRSSMEAGEGGWGEGGGGAGLSSLPSEQPLSRLIKHTHAQKNNDGYNWKSSAEPFAHAHTFPPTTLRLLPDPGPAPKCTGHQSEAMTAVNPRLGL